MTLSSTVLRRWTASRLSGCFFSVVAVLTFAPGTEAIAGLPDILTVYFGGPLNNAPVTRFDIDSNSPVFSRPSGTTGFGDMVLTSDGRYLTYRARRYDSPPGLFEVYPTDGTTSLLVESEDAPEYFLSLAALPDGDLYGYALIETSPGSFADKMLRLDPETLDYEFAPWDVTLVPQALATSPDGEVYLWAAGSDSGSMFAFAKLFTVDPDTGSTSEIGGLEGLEGGINGFADMAFTQDGRLFGFTAINASPFTPNSVYEFDLQTGVPSLVSTPGEIFSSLRGVEFLPIPEPSTPALAALSILIISLLRPRLSQSATRWTG